MKSKSLWLYESMSVAPNAEDQKTLFDMVAKGAEQRLANWDLAELNTAALWAEFRVHEESLMVDLYKPDCTPVKRNRSIYPKKHIDFENGVCLQLEPDRVWVPQYISFAAEYCIPKDVGLPRFKRLVYFEL